MPVLLNSRSALVVIAGAMVLPAALLAVGTFMPGIPYPATAGTKIFTAAAGPFVVVALVGAMLALAAARRGARRTGAGLVIVGVLTAAAAGAVIGNHVRIAEANGVSIGILATVVPLTAGAGVTPNETHRYTQVDGQDLLLDIYRPKGSPGVPAPVAIYIHGGGWIAGDRAAKAANLRWLADHGYLGVSLDYVLATEEKATWRTATSQVACGLSWVALNASKYGGDPERLFVFGESAGGALALTTAYAAATGVATSSCGGLVPAVRAVAVQVPALDPVTLYQNPDPGAGGRARQMVTRYLGGTPMDHPDRARAVASATYITPKAPPTLMILSDNDRLVPIEGALQFIDRAMQAGVSLRVVRFPWADHGVAALYYSVVNQASLQMMRQYFCRHGGACE